MAEVVANMVVGEVVEPLLTKVTQEIRDSFFTMVKREIGYAWNCKKNVEKLRSEVGKLKTMMGRVQQRIKLATEKGEELLDGVQEWVDEADGYITKAEEFLQEEAIAKKTCFDLRMCVNLKTLHHYGKQATNKVPSLEQHQKDGVTYEGVVSIPTPSPGILDLYQRKNIDELETHKSVLENIIKSIEDESIQIIGIYGTGGVGKTTLAKEVAAKMKDRELFSLVVFVTVSQRVDATEIQKEVEVAAKRIMKREKVLIILDDMWRELKLDEVGIPCGSDHPNCKILLTSRKRSVCRAMNAQEIGVDSLPIEEAWILFKRVAGQRIETDAKLKRVAMKVAEGCGGLPLIIQVVGNALKSESITEWEIALEKLENHETSDIDPEISLAFTHLKLSYDYLDNEEVRTCFLLCSMFPEDYSIPLECLVYYGVGLQVFKDLKSLEAARNKVQGAVRILKSSCLLLDGEDEFKTKMHDVVREVALLIASKDNNKFLVEAGKDLTEWEPRNESIESHTGISLMYNNICKLPARYELKIPLLNIFLAQGNRNLSVISDEFILAMKEVKVIDFERNNITSLPKSLNELTRLRMLNLGGNRFLNEISVLGELTHLQILILNETGITEIPQEIGNLVNLRLFNVQRCRGLSHIAPGVLLKLHWLEELHVGYYPVEEGNYNSLVEIGEMSNLKFLTLDVPHIYLIPEGDYLKRLKRFLIQINGYEERIVSYIPGDRILYLRMPYLDISHLMQVKKWIEVSDGIFLRLIENLNIIMPLMYYEAFGMRTIYIRQCANLSCLVDSRILDEMQTSHPSKAHAGVKENRRFLSEVEFVWLYDLSSLNVIWNCPDQYISLNNLVKCEIFCCPRLQKLFTVNVAQGLVNLRKLTVDRCASLKEVISEGDEETSNDEINTVLPATNIVFPSLAKICLRCLDNLTSFYPKIAIIKYPLLVKVKISRCDKMETWGYGTHDTPNLQFFNKKKVNGSTIDDVVAKNIEDELRITQMQDYLKEIGF